MDIVACLWVDRRYAGCVVRHPPQSSALPPSWIGALWCVVHACGGGDDVYVPNRPPRAAESSCAWLHGERWCLSTQHRTWLDGEHRREREMRVRVLVNICGWGCRGVSWGVLSRLRQKPLREAPLSLSSLPVSSPPSSHLSCPGPHHTDPRAEGATHRLSQLDGAHRPVHQEQAGDTGQATGGGAGGRLPARLLRHVRRGEAQVPHRRMAPYAAQTGVCGCRTREC
jgi:hypothetical protein